MKLRQRHNWIKRNRKIKNFILKEQPYFNPDDGSIHGCDENTYAWFHEKRHRKQDLYLPFTTLATKIHIYEYYLQIGFIIWGSVIMFFTGYNRILSASIIILVFLTSLPNLFILFFLELDAYLFGWIDYKKYKNEHN